MSQKGSPVRQTGLAPILIVILTAASVGGYLLYQNQSRPFTVRQPSDNTQDRPTQPSPVSEVTPESIKLAQQDLAKTLNTDPSQIEVKSIENIMWNDGSLGCPKQGMMYTLAVVPGYKAIFSYHQKMYKYHTDKTSSFVTCESK